MNESVKKISRLGMLSAASVLLVCLIHFPLLPAVSFLEYDPADIPILLVALAFGPLEGLAVTVAVSLVQGLTVSAASGFYGILMHILATGAYCFVCGVVHGQKKTKKAAVLALVFGALAMIAVMYAANLIVTPYFMGSPVEVIQSLMPMILLFNAVKAGINGTLAFLVYDAIVPVLRPRKTLKKKVDYEGTVAYGNQIGNTIGFPTVNIFLSEQDSFEKGVYASLVYLDDGRIFESVTNVGLHPTVGESDKTLAESYLFDFNENLYGKHIAVQLVKFIRPETKFDSLEDLKEQILQDKISAKKIFRKLY